LKYNKDAVAAAVASGEKQEEDGIEAAFEVLHEISERLALNMNFKEILSSYFQLVFAQRSGWEIVSFTQIPRADSTTVSAARL